MTHRQLILVSKVLQNLANDTLPGTKEAYMERLNAFITTNKPALERFYAQIVEHPDLGNLTSVTVHLPRLRHWFNSLTCGLTDSTASKERFLAEGATVP